MRKKTSRQVSDATKRNRHFLNWFNSVCGSRRHDPSLADKDDFALERWLTSKDPKRSAKAKAELLFRRTYDYVFDVGFSAWARRGLWDQGKLPDDARPKERLAVVVQGVSMLSLASFLGLD
jgi:hypothetical protein